MPPEHLCCCLLGESLSPISGSPQSTAVKHSRQIRDKPLAQQHLEKKKKIFPALESCFILRKQPGKISCPHPLPVPPPSSHHSHPMYLFFLSDQRAAFGLFQTTNINHQDRTCSFYMVGLCWTAKQFCRLLEWAIGWVKARSSKSRLVSQRQLCRLRLLWPFLFIFV